jgi:hypothetical protein
MLRKHRFFANPDEPWIFVQTNETEAGLRASAVMPALER